MAATLINGKIIETNKSSPTQNIRLVSHYFIQKNMVMAFNNPQPLFLSGVVLHCLNITISDEKKDFTLLPSMGSLITEAPTPIEAADKFYTSYSKSDTISTRSNFYVQDEEPTDAQKRVISKDIKAKQIGFLVAAAILNAPKVTNSNKIYNHYLSKKFIAKPPEI